MGIAMRIRFSGPQYAYKIDKIDTAINVQDSFLEKQWEFDKYDRFHDHIKNILQDSCEFSEDIGEEGKYADLHILEFDCSEVRDGTEANSDNSTDEISENFYFPSPWEKAINDGKLIAASSGMPTIVFYKFIEYKDCGYIVMCEIDENTNSTYHIGSNFYHKKQFRAPFSSVEIIHKIPLRNQYGIILHEGNFM
jgi:hypothetical protein